MSVFSRHSFRRSTGHFRLTPLSVYARIKVLHSLLFIPCLCRRVWLLVKMLWPMKAHGFLAGKCMTKKCFSQETRMETKCHLSMIHLTSTRETVRSFADQISRSVCRSLGHPVVCLSPDLTEPCLEFRIFVTGTCECMVSKKTENFQHFFNFPFSSICLFQCTMLWFRAFNGKVTESFGRKVRTDE